MWLVVARVFSGIEPTGDMHLGNFIGAVQRWVDSQPAAGSPGADRHDAVYCVVDLHAMTMPYEPAELTIATRRLATLLMAAGLDPGDACCSCRATCARMPSSRGSSTARRPSASCGG